ncbi:MAG: polyprenyl synthetase family protein [Syntrophomonadaceae bacterium]
MLAIKADTILDKATFPVGKVKKRLQQVLFYGDSEVDLILNYMLENSGKMLRPQMVYLSGSLHPNDNSDSLIDIAVAVELIHMASLVHDDIIDHSEIRRGRPSINQRWGNQVSVLTGDFLFATAFNLISQCQQPRVMDNLTNTIKVMCFGEIKQMNLLYNLNQSESDYFDRIYCKTGCLFASSCKVGAILSRASENEIEKIEKVGLYFGYAYQIIDDVLDFVSDTILLGKPVANDLNQGNITLPVILALKDNKYAKQIKDQWPNGLHNPQKLKQIQNIIKASGSLEESVRLSRYYMNLSLNVLKQLPNSPVLDEIRYLINYLLNDYYKKLNTANNNEKLVLSAE